jgi:hypothetical protein
MIVAGSASPLLLSSAGGYNLTNSLRFRSSASAYLNRTPASASNRQVWTWSGWVKRGALGVYSPLFIAGTTNGQQVGSLAFSSAGGVYDKLELNFGVQGTSTEFWLQTTQVFRDPSAWYHIVCAVDTTQATASNRVKFYVNGTQITALSSYGGYSQYPSQNYNTSVNNTVQHLISRDQVNTAGYFDGYLAEVNFIDGQALTPSSFGQTSAITGVWIPKKYTGTYGTNGFYLDFEDTSSTAALGYDAAGSNDWTVNNISLTAGSTYDSMTDVPTLTSATAANYCTLNPISNPNGTIVTYSDGNLAFSHSSSSGNAPKMTVQGTMALPAGKFYWEYTVGATVNDQVGIGTMLVVGGSADGTAGARYLNGGTFQSSYTTPSSAASYTTGDVIGMAYDQPNGTLAFYKNNSLQGTVTNISTSEVFFPLRSPNTSGSGGAGVFNFGQRPFTYTPPSGFLTLNTTNLPTPTIGTTSTTQANKYFDATLYTGNGTTNTITNAGGFQPDFVWMKDRTNAYFHGLYDSVRGTGTSKSLYSNSTDAEGTNSANQNLTSFNSNGFSLGSTSSTNAINANGDAYVGWQWRASNATAVTNTSGSITSTVSANTTAGFSIVTFTTQSSGTATVGHGLGVAPSMIITKLRTDASNWNVFHSSVGNTGILSLNTTGATTTNSQYWNNTSPTSSVFTTGTWYTGSLTAVAYCFAQVAGYSAFGSYTGNGSTDGTFVYTGFRPRWLMIKRTDATQNWAIVDTSRDTFNVSNKRLFANLSDAEDTGIPNFVDLLSNGFKFRDSNVSCNASGGTYIYMAFAESPFRYANAR